MPRRAMRIFPRGVLSAAHAAFLNRDGETYAELAAPFAERGVSAEILRAVFEDEIDAAEAETPSVRLASAETMIAAEAAARFLCEPPAEAALLLLDVLESGTAGESPLAAARFLTQAAQFGSTNLAALRLAFSVENLKAIKEAGKTFREATEAVRKMAALGWEPHEAVRRFLDGKGPQG